jgi:hypothetical protein
MDRLKSNTSGELASIFSADATDDTHAPRAAFITFGHRDDYDDTS